MASLHTQKINDTTRYYEESRRILLVKEIRDNSGKYIRSELLPRFVKKDGENVGR